MSALQQRSCDELVIRPTAVAWLDRLIRTQQTWVLAACVLGSSMAFIDSSVVNVALPKMESELETTLAYMTWVINAYTLCMSALLLIGGAAADQIGRRRIFIIGITIFAIASIGCGLAPNVQVLILARAVQGVGAALLIPCSLAIIGAAFSEKERGAAIGVWSGASAIAAGSAPLMGGLLVDHVSWRAIFLINPLIALPTILIALRHVPESVDTEAKKGLDGPGAALAFFGLGLLVFGLIAASDRGWSSPLVLGSILLGVVLLIVFVAAERRSPTPMMPLSVFRSLTFSGVNILTLLLYGALGGTMFFLPFLLIQVHGYTATDAGASFLPFTIILALLSRWGGGLVDRLGARLPLIVGPTISGHRICAAGRTGHERDLLDDLFPAHGGVGVWHGSNSRPADNHCPELSGTAPDRRRLGHQQRGSAGGQPAADCHPGHSRNRDVEQRPRSKPR